LLAEAIKAYRGDDYQVSVRFGSIAEGIIPVRWTSTGYQTPRPKPHFPAWGIPLRHPAFVRVPGAFPTLWIQVIDGVVGGGIGRTAGAAMIDDPSKYRAAFPTERLIGGLGGFSNVRLQGEIVNSLWKGVLIYDVPRVTFDLDDYHGTGHLRV